VATSTNQEIVRPLYDWEIKEAREVFADSLNYDRVRVHECAGWPDAIHVLGHRLQGRPINPDEHNAITLGYHCYFPISMPRELTPVGNPFGMIWLIHELTHAWQYQHIGWSYLAKAFRVQITLGEAGYQYGDEAGLVAARQNNLPFSSFNPEQQGNITRDYYIRQRTGQDASAWSPYIDTVQKGV
jgi:type VI secretion system secreted protein VgrG